MVSVVREGDLVVIGLHAVFEHHQAQGRTEVLEAFVHEYRLTFPIGIDTPSPHDPIPQTMRAYGMRGTPSLLLFDRDGKLVLHKFGAVDDLALGATIATHLVRPSSTEAPPSAPQPGSAPWDDEGCPR